MLEDLKKYSVVLASNSPRRKELLSGLGVNFSVKTLPDVDESFPDTLKGEEIPLFIARKKADAYKVLFSSVTSNEVEEPLLVITADTIVWLEDEVLGKPANATEARAMLSKLSGKKHQVITGVCLTTASWQKSFAAVSEVQFSSLTEEEMDYYIQNYCPYDKAGAYGVQEWIGFIGVESIQGSYFNVMGLPIQRLYRELKTIK
ncbi:MAG: Maf-like protein [Bacteroides graminisolvens]|uniref:dTTP/UTP pyrophosphatase n=2 Tax=root TaxID=1 RepID=A0A3D2SGC2_9BACE|nr:Maf-like protein [Bacteroides graminisolvens]MCD8541849.1 Maf-like protein [Bacteroides graminisolvens]MCD8572869.1 Maf-like protein [Bacteroides graminisolvens]MEA4885229.1 Maf-like protein [Bacteroides graminisolvens]HCK25313.1 septum formation protein Maf [Bacteroides graminisolvens]